MLEYEDLNAVESAQQAISRLPAYLQESIHQSGISFRSAQEVLDFAQHVQQQG